METVFESANIRYVVLSEELIGDYLQMVNDYENVARFIGLGPEGMSEDAEREWLRGMLARDAAAFSMLEKRGGGFIGNIELMEIDADEAFLGIAITAKKQNAGYGREAIAAILDYGKAKYGLRRVRLKVFPNNLRAQRVYEKCGFTEYARTESDIFMEIRLQ